MYDIGGITLDKYEKDLEKEIKYRKRETRGDIALLLLMALVDILLLLNIGVLIYRHLFFNILPNIIWFFLNTYSLKKFHKETRRFRKDTNKLKKRLEGYNYG